MRRGGRLQSEPVSGPILLLCNPHCLPPCSRVGYSPNGVVSNPKARKVSPPPSIPSKWTTSKGSSDPGPSRRPTMDSRHVDSTHAQTKTPAPLTFSPSTWPNKPTVICADPFPLSPDHVRPLVNPLPLGSGVIPLSSTTPDPSPAFPFPPMPGDYSTPSTMTTDSDSMYRHHTVPKEGRTFTPPPMATIKPDPTQPSSIMPTEGCTVVNPQNNPFTSRVMTVENPIDSPPVMDSDPTPPDGPLNRVESTPKTTNTSGIPVTADSASVFTHKDLKTGSGMLVSDECRLSFRTVFRVNREQELNCFSFGMVGFQFVPYICVNPHGRSPAPSKIAVIWHQVCPLAPCDLVLTAPPKVCMKGSWE